MTIEETKAYFEGFPEAPCSDSFKWVDPQGFEHLTTLRAWHFKPLMNAYTEAQMTIIELGGKPISTQQKVTPAPQVQEKDENGVPVVDQEGQHEYTIVVEDTDKGEKFSLFTSNGSQWNDHAKGQLQLALTNDGNGCTFDRKMKKMDYSELLYVRLLVNFENQTDKHELNREKYKVIEMKTLLEL
jgi:hypothetical protein